MLARSVQKEEIEFRLDRKFWEMIYWLCKMVGMLVLLRVLSV